MGSLIAGELGNFKDVDRFVMLSGIFAPGLSGIKWAGVMGIFKLDRHKI